MEWRKRNEAVSSIGGVVESNTGIPLDEFLNPTESPIANLKEAVALVKETVDANKPITIIGDYDADGVTGSAILFTAIREYNPTFAESRLFVRLPRRITEGYGLNESIVDEVSDGLILTVDNGIAANDAVKKATDRGIPVVILDHHVALSDKLPQADVTVDPHVFAEEGAFVDFCGAGLAYRFSRLLLGRTMPEISALAAIGTVADVVPLVRDNRLIVQEGLEAINNRNVSYGLGCLLDTVRASVIDSETIAFNIAPCINAPGRLQDDGAEIPLRLLLLSNEKNQAEAKALVDQVVKLNRTRKALVERAMAKIEAVNDMKQVPIMVYFPAASEGIVGLIAGKLAEKYKAPALVFTNSMTPGIFKGSGRSYGGYNLINALKKAEKYFQRFGGHAAAAGFSVVSGDFDDLRDSLQDAMKDYDKGSADVSYYDLYIPASSVPDAFRTCQVLEPFGAGNPKPVFKIAGFEVKAVCRDFYRVFGKDGKHIKLNNPQFSAIGYDFARAYLADPRSLYTLYGTLGLDSWSSDGITVTLDDLVAQ